MTGQQTRSEAAEMRRVARWAYRVAIRLDQRGECVKAGDARELARLAAKEAYRLEARRG